MPIKVTSTKRNGSGHVNILTHGMAGVGKTMMCATTGEPTLVISAEAGLFTLRNFDIATVEVKTMEDLLEVYKFLSGSKEAEKYKWVCIDSISEVGEVVLESEKKKTDHGMQAYGAMKDRMTSLVRKFRDLPKNLYMTAKTERIKDELTGSLLYAPSAPGVKLAASLPYFFDFVFALRAERNKEGEIVRWLQTQPDMQWTAKDRSGVLGAAEPPNLKAVMQKILKGDANGNA